MVLTINKIYAHGETNFTWSTLSLNSLYDFKNSKFTPNIDLNTSFLIINAGIGYKELGYLGKNGTTGYLGLGVGNILQFQSGFSSYGCTFRFRSDLILGDFSENFAKKHPYLSLTTFSLKAEKYFKPDLKWFLGLGIGISCNTIDGITHFK